MAFAVMSSLDVPGLGDALVSNADVLAQLDRIIASHAFETSDRNRRFLRYVVEETISGRGDRIKAYAIATSVFGRGDDFDPQADPIIRIEASRLRRAVDHYYLTAGQDDPVRIAIPKGTYIPQFTRVMAAAATRIAQTVPGRRMQAACETAGSKPQGERLPWWPVFRLPDMLSKRPVAAIALAVLVVAALPASAWLLYPAAFSAGSLYPNAPGRGPTVVVLPFDTIGTPPQQRVGIAREITAELTRYKELFVVADAGLPPGEPSDRPALPAAGAAADFVVSGWVEVTAAGQVQVAVSLVNRHSRRHVWSDTFAGSAGEGGLLPALRTIAGRVASALADPYGGAIPVETARGAAGKSWRTLSSYECAVSARFAGQRPGAEPSQPIRDCLERAIKADPADAGAQASLALLLLGDRGMGLGDIRSAADRAERPDRRAAVELAQHAVELAPDSAAGQQALSQAYWLRGDVGRSVAAAARAQALNPNNSEIMAELGARYAMRDDWEKALPLLDEASARNPALPAGYRLLIALNRYIGGRYAEALAEARKVNHPDAIYAHVLLAIAHDRLGQTSEAAAEVRYIRKIDPDFATRVVPDLEARNLHPDLIRAITEGLRGVGIEVKLDTAAAAVRN